MRAADTAEISGGEISNALDRLGYESFRPGQWEALETLLARHKLLLVAPTGGGKSLIYQLPALLLPGTSLVQQFFTALEEEGLGEEGTQALVKALERLAETEVR